MLLELQGVGKRFESAGGGAVLEILKDINLSVEAGESLAVVGPSGSGKSTLLNIIGALDRPTTGRVAFEGRDLAALDDDALAELRSRRIGFIFQAHHLLPQCSVLENVLVPTLILRDADLKASAEVRARELLQRVGLTERIAHHPGQLSGGERQRVAVVRALINRPKLLLADEPTGALDAGTASQLGELLVELNRDLGVTLITVTHAAGLAERMGRRLELRGGTLVQSSEANNP
ncbi:MAG: ABC transporter ATP-binding protein [Planctomycetes bacterium]|nr:ABC transporter ATP-binding protein [Planctomycetota bacterium]